MVRKYIVIMLVSSFLGLCGNKDTKESSAKSAVKEMAECGKIVAGSIAAACIYGILNDQVTARVCPEYFTKGFHEEMVDRMQEGWVKRTLSTTQSPTTLGLVWGVIATWWMGAALSVPVTLAARTPYRNTEKLRMNDLVKPTVCALGCMGLASLTAGIIGYKKAIKDKKFRDSFIFAAQGVPEKSLTRFIADACAHRVAYASGVVAAAGLCGWTIYERYRRKKLKDS